MWMYQTIESKYYEYMDFSVEERTQLIKTFIKGVIGTHTFRYVENTNDYVKMADDAEFTENVVCIRKSDIKGEAIEGNAPIRLRCPDCLHIEFNSARTYIGYDAFDFVEACKTIYKGRNTEYGNTDLTLKLIELFYNYILPKYGVNYIWLVEENSNYDKQFNALIYKITNFVNSTYKYYSPLIDAYLVNESHLLDKIQTIVENEASSEGSGSSISLQNDTPGELNEGYDATHTSFASKETNSSTSGSSSTATYSKDVEPLIDKLNRIRTKYADLYAEWADKFESILCGFNM